MILGILSRITGTNAISLSTGLIFLAVGAFGLNIGSAIYDSTYTNFLVSDLNIDAFQIGVMESVREIPGLLTVFILGSIMSFSRPLLAGISVLIFGLGIAGISVAGNWVEVTAWLVVWSVGFHCWTPLRSSIAMYLGEPRQEGKRIGQIYSVASIASITATASVAIVGSLMTVEYRFFFIAAGLITVFFGIFVFQIPSERKMFKPVRFVVKKRYITYYIMSFLEGARRQIFSIFALFVLVKIFSQDVTVIAITLVVRQILTFVSAPYVGKLLDRIGPKIVLTANYVLMIGNFLVYAYVRNVFFLLAVYTLSSVLIGISMISLVVYVGKTSPPEDVTPSLAMGQTIEHIAAVILPLAGGIMWGLFGYEANFLVGAVVTLSLLILVQRIDRT